MLKGVLKMKIRNTFVWKAVIAFVCALIVSIGFQGFTFQTVAASKAVRAKKAYSKMLSRKKLKWSSYSKYNTRDMQFACIDMNGDKIPELILQYDHAIGAEGRQRLYTYRNGKVKKVFESGNGDGIGEIYPRRKVFVNSGGRMGMGWKYHNLFSKGRVTRKAEEWVNLSTNKRSYKIQGKSVSRAKYRTYIKKLVKKQKAKSYKLRDNNAYNRRRYLK